MIKKETITLHTEKYLCTQYISNLVEYYLNYLNSKLKLNLIKETEK